MKRTPVATPGFVRVPGGEGYSSVSTPRRRG